VVVSIRRTGRTADEFDALIGKHFGIGRNGDCEATPPWHVSVAGCCLRLAYLGASGGP
jgi:hypothetical protein